MANEKLITSIIPIEGRENRFVAGIGNKICKIAWDGIDKKIEKIEPITEINYKVKGSTNYQWNDAKVDYQGSLWISKYQVLYFQKYESTYVCMYLLTEQFLSD